jgi:hypothetical protein
MSSLVTPIVVNPYARRRNVAFFAAADSSNKDDFNMGCQSQRSEGAVRKVMKQVTKQTIYKFRRSLVQSGVDGGRAFISLRDCIICKAIQLSAKKSRCLDLDYRSAFRIGVMIGNVERTK